MRKMLSMLLALLMLVLPAISLAATPAEIMAMPEGRTLYTDVTFTPGDLPLDGTAATMAKDLLNALTFSTKVGGADGDVSGLSVSLNGVKVLTFDAQVKEDTLYLATSLLDHPVAFTADEAADFAKQLLTLLGDAVDVDVTSLVESLTANTWTYVTNSAYDAVKNFTFDLEGFTTVTERMSARIVTEEVTEQTKDHEPATTKMTMTITAEDVKDLMKVFADACHSNEALMTALHQANVTYTLDGQEVTEDEFFEGLPGTMEKALSCYEDIVLVAMTNANGETVHASVTLTPKADAEANVLPIAIVYNRLGTADGMGHSLTVTLTSDDSDAVLSVDYLTDAEKKVSFSFAMSYIKKDGTVLEVMSFTADGTKENGDTQASSDVTYTAAFSGDGTAENRTSLSVNVQESASFDGKDAVGNKTVAFYLNGSKTPMVTITVDQATDKAADDIDAQSAVHPGKMTEEELSAFFEEALTSAQTNLLVILQNLPASILQALTDSSN